MLPVVVKRRSYKAESPSSKLRRTSRGIPIGNHKAQWRRKRVRRCDTMLPWGSTQMSGSTKSRKQRVRWNDGKHRVCEPLHDQMMWYLSTPRSPEYILPVALSISVTLVAQPISVIPVSPYTCNHWVLYQADCRWWRETDCPGAPWKPLLLPNMLLHARSRDLLSCSRKAPGGMWQLACGSLTKSWRQSISQSELYLQCGHRDMISRCLTARVLTITPFDSAGKVDTWLLGRADLWLRFSSRICCPLPIDCGRMYTHFVWGWWWRWRWWLRWW